MLLRAARSEGVLARRGRLLLGGGGGALDQLGDVLAELVLVDLAPTLVPVTAAKLDTALAELATRGRRATVRCRRTRP